MRTLYLMTAKMQILAACGAMLIAVSAMVYKAHQKQICLQPQETNTSVDKNKILSHAGNPLQLFAK